MGDDVRVARWQILGSQVALMGEDGAAHDVSADEVYAAEFEAKSIVCGYSVRRPSSDLPHLQFERFPLDLQLIISQSGVAQAPCRLELYGTSADGARTLLDRTPVSGHALVNAHWYPIRCGVLEEIDSLLGPLELAPNGLVSLGTYLRLHQAARATPELLVDRTGDDGESRSLSDSVIACLPDTSLPHMFRGTLYPYQETGFRWLELLVRDGVGCILADEMGLGKTVQLIALMCRVLEDGQAPVLVVCPSTIAENWRREVERFAPQAKVLVHAGRGRTGFPAGLGTADVVVTSYETLCSDLALFQMLKWPLVVLDEAQAIKNPVAKRTLAAKALRKVAGIAVTGTPVENSLLDLWSLTDFAMPGLLGARSAYDGDRGISEATAAEVDLVVAPLMLRRRVAEVARELPPKIDIPEPLLMSPMEAEGYEELRKSLRDRHAGFGGVLQLQMYCGLAGESVIDGNTCVRALEESVKYARLVEELTEVMSASERALVFASYHAASDLMTHDLAQRFGVTVLALDGRTPLDARQTAVDRLNNDDARILVLNAEVGGTGLNITGANHVFHYNLQWNPAKIDQATARAYRRGQERPVMVHYMFYAGTVEEVIVDRLEKKRRVADAAVRGTDGRRTDAEDIVRALSLSPLLSGGLGRHA